MDPIGQLTKWMRNFLGFSQTEMWGYTGIITLLAVATGILPFLKTASPNLGGSNQELMLLDSLIITWEPNLPRVVIEDSIKSSPIKPFSPATVSRDSLIKWGVPFRVADNLVKYRNAGGRFRSKSDLRKIYGMNDSLWNYLVDYIKLPRQNVPSEASPEAVVSAKVSIMDINKADSIQLTSIRGIGPVLSSRIVRYRDLLGGFYSLEQLKEVYGLPEPVLHSLKESVMIKADFKYHKISLNSFDFKQLSKHPYINYDQARAIIAYRKVHGPFTEFDQLKLIHLIDDHTFNKLLPYLDF